jgi:amino acid permease
MEQSIEFQQETKPKTYTVLGLLAMTALVFSYLGAYAVYNALVTAQVVERFAGRDPRPRWLLVAFCVLMLVFMSVGELFRRLSKSDFKAIDAMAEAKDDLAL